MRPTLGRIILYVRDVQRLSAFYRDVFGLRLVEEIDGEWAVLAAGGCELALHRAGAAFRPHATIPAGINSNAKLVFTSPNSLLRCALS